MAIRNPYLPSDQMDKLIMDTWGIRIDRDDNMRVIWFGDGRLRHTHTLWKNLHTVHNDIWSWRNWEPDVLWCYHMGLKGWCQSLRDYNGNTRVNALLKGKDSELLCLPRDIELYNALLGE